MKSIEQFGFAGAIGLLLAAIGIVTPIVWDRYRTRTELELQFLRSATIVDGTQAVEKLLFLYDGATVPSLARLEFALVNTGRTPITREQIVETPTVAISSGQILEAKLQRTEPSGVDVQYSPDTSRRLVKISFPLLNPGDAAYFLVLATSSNPTISVTARIAGLRQLTFRDQRQPVASAKVRNLTWSFYVVSGITGILILMIPFGLYLSGGEAAIKSAGRAGTIRLPRGLTPDALSALLHRAFTNHADQEIRAVLAELSQDPAGTPLTDLRTAEIERKALAKFDNMASIWGVGFFAILAAIGLTFVLTRLF